MPQEKYEAVIFDLLTAPLNSWSLWNDVAGDDNLGWDWRKRYLQLTVNVQQRQVMGLAEELSSELSAAGGVVLFAVRFVASLFLTVDPNRLGV